MYEVRRLSTTDLTSDLIDQLAPLTSPENRTYLHGIDPSDVENLIFIIIVAFEGTFYPNCPKNRNFGIPLGLALATVLPSAKIGTVHSLYVEKAFRKKGVGRDLLKAVESSFIEEACYLATFLYPSKTPTEHAFENLLLETQWHAPTVYMRRYFFNCQLFNAPWFNRHYPRFKDLKLFPWKELTQEERALLKRREEQLAFPKFVSPFLHEEKIEPLNSLGLRYGGEVIGWMINHRISQDTICYASLYSDPEFQHRGFVIHLLAEAIRLQKQSQIPWSIFDLNLEQTDQNWQRFIEKRLKPWAQISEIKRTWKEFLV